MISASPATGSTSNRSASTPPARRRPTGWRCAHEAGAHRRGRAIAGALAVLAGHALAGPANPDLAGRPGHSNRARSRPIGRCGRQRHRPADRDRLRPGTGPGHRDRRRDRRHRGDGPAQPPRAVLLDRGESRPAPAAAGCWARRPPTWTSCRERRSPAAAISGHYSPHWTSSDDDPAQRESHGDRLLLLSDGLLPGARRAIEAATAELEAVDRAFSPFATTRW